ncbi:MAG: redoxin domain-containing protein [Planctomycetes bacterium]|nr:redoxin domain-containing protein [Planctomycetota bacterium]
MLSTRTSVLTCVLATAAVAQQSPEPPPSFGHSAHGAAYDEGPRQRPWPIDGIGRAPFPITTKVPEVQRWFDQANALLHSFWYHEAERALRWCIQLDPDCAMAYWALSRAVPYDRDRSKAFLDQAIERKHLVSERERRYIQAWEEAFVPSLERVELGRPGWNATSPKLAEELEKIVLDYPDDIEAKALYALNTMFHSGKYAVEAVLKEILAVAPEHPGAIHYRIHNWDSLDLGHVALDSCAAYGRVAWRVGHANHMPGHIYTKLGMWHEGAISLDAATRVEKDYMRERLVLPHQAWNYAHNRNFLAYAQSMLGMPSAALQGAHDMLNAPLDPDRNRAETGYSVFREGMDALRRTLVRFERWNEILEEGRIPWRDTDGDRLWRTYCEALANLGLGNLDVAEERALELRKLDDEAAAAAKGAPPPPAFEDLDAEERDKLFEAMRLADVRPIMRREVEGRLWLRRGDSVRGLRSLVEAAELEFAHREKDSDPPVYPRCLYNVLGEAYLELGSYRPAIAAFEKALEVIPNNGFSWSGIARARHALGEVDAARTALGRMRHTWSGVEPGVWQAERAEALGLDAAPEDVSPGPQRDYARTTLAELGPNTWQPYHAPMLEARDAQGRSVTLEDYRGRNVLLVFYLSDECVHCVEQLHAIEEKIGEFEKRDTVVLAISSDSPERNAANDVGRLPFTVLSDSADHANAIRFKSYDEFEGIELHSTQLIDSKGRLRWIRSGGDPFMDVPFLLAELDRMARIDARERLVVGDASSAAAPPDGSGR